MTHHGFARIVNGLAFIGCLKVSQSQLCSSANYTLIDEPRRSTMSIYDSAVDTPFCDDNLHEDEWFRFDSYAGNSIPERAPNDFIAINRCGTQGPIYIRGLGSHPTADHTTRDATVCANYASGPCHWNATIKIYKCPTQGTAESYFLYKLKRAPGCSLAYCAGEGAPCNRGDYWNGVQCVNYFPTMSGFPIFGGPYTNGSQSGFTMEVYFTCTVQYIRRANDTNARFRVTFLFDGLPLESVSVAGSKTLRPFVITAGSNMNVALGEYYLKGRLDRQIGCKAESYWEGYEPTGNSTMLSLINFYIGFQSNISSYTFSFNSGSTYPITFRSSIPLTCSHCVGKDNDCCRYEFRMNQQSTAAAMCHIRWEGIGSTTVTAYIDATPGQSQSIASYGFEFFPYTGDEFSAWGNYSLWRSYVVPPVKFTLIPSSVTYKECRSISDPDITTFDGRGYSISYVGDYYLVNTNIANKKMEVQVRQQTCRWGVCDCGVIVREGNSVYRISMCENGPPNTVRTPTIVRLLSQEPTDSSTIYRDGSGNAFSVRMPSGLRVEVFTAKYPYSRPTLSWLNIYVYLPPEYHGRTDSASICGNSNQNYNDDITTPQNFVVPDQLNYFRTQPQCSSVYNPAAKSCDCLGNRPGSPNFKCSNADPLLSTVSQAQDHLPDRWTSGIVCRHQGALTLSQLANEDASDFVLGPEILYTPYEHEPNDGLNVSYTWPTPKGKTENETEQYCSGIFSSSASYIDCKDTVDIAYLINICKSDTQRIDEWIQGAPYVEIMQQSCINALAAVINSSDIYDNSSYTSLTAVSQKWCPNQCSNHGNCNEGKCICNRGYIGADCGIEDGVPPTLSAIMRGDVCDVQRRLCEVISVFGTGVASTAMIKCRFNNIDASRYSETTGAYVTGGEFSCPVPTTSTHRRKRRSTDTRNTALSKLTVQLTTDGVNYSNPIPFTVYDSKCLECSTSNNCKQKTDSCLIENECFTSGAVNSEDLCFGCVPATSRNSWVNITTLENWQKCSRQCDYGSQARDTVCGTTVKHSELKLCKLSDCATIRTQKTEGVGFTLSQDDLAKILLDPSATLKTFADVISYYCVRNGIACCNSLRKSYTNTKQVTFTSPDLVSYASGYPEVTSTNEASVKIIVKIDQPLVESQCAGTSTESSNLVDASKSLLYEIAATEKGKLEQELGVTLNSIWKPNSASSLKISLFVLVCASVALFYRRY